MKRKGLEIVPNNRFITLRVDWRIPIREFVEEVCRLHFERGRGFYQFSESTRPQLIRENTQVVLRDKRTGKLSSGTGARRIIGLPMGKRARLKPVKLDQYDIFVQSCSQNRKLKEETKLLYETEQTKKEGLQ